LNSAVWRAFLVVTRRGHGDCLDKRPGTSLGGRPIGTIIMASTTCKSATEASVDACVVCAHRGGVEIIDQLADEWRDLCAEAADAQPFYRPEWIRAYLRAFVPAAKLVLIAVRIESRLRMLLPLIEEAGTFSKVPVRKLRAPVNFCAGRFDAVCGAGPDADAAIRATWKYLKGLRSWDLLQFRDALEGSAASRLAEVAQAEGHRTIQIPDKPSPYVTIPQDPSLLDLMPVNARLRRELRHVRRQLAEQHSRLNFHRVETADRDALDRFYELEAGGWKGRESSAIISSQMRPFFDEVAESAAHFGYFTLYMLELNGQLAAAQYGFTQGTCYYSVIVAYNESFREYSPGHLIVDEIVRDCAARGIRRFDITGQNQEWKMRWTKAARPVNHHFVFRGPLGNLAYTVASKLRPGVGRLLPWRPRDKRRNDSVLDLTEG